MPISFEQAFIRTARTYVATLPAAAGPPCIPHDPGMVMVGFLAYLLLRVRPAGLRLSNEPDRLAKHIVVDLPPLRPTHPAPWIESTPGL